MSSLTRLSPIQEARKSLQTGSATACHSAYLNKHATETMGYAELLMASMVHKESTNTPIMFIHVMVSSSTPYPARGQSA